MEEETGLENELLNDTAEALPSDTEEEEVDRANHNNNGQYGWIDVDGKQCTNDYTSRAYGQQYCVGDTYTDPNGGTQTIRAITMTGLDMAPNDWDAEETYADVGEKLGMSMEEWVEFSAEIQALNSDVDALKGNMFGPTDQERGRLGIRISNENPDWTEEQVMAEADRLLEEKWMTSDAYREAALAETALFEKYGITKPNPAVYGTGTWIDSDGKYFRFESSSGNLWQTSQDTSFLDVAVPLGIAIGASLIAGGGAGTLFNGSGLLASSGLGPTMQGALQGAIGSAFGQGVTGNGIDPKKLLQAAMLGGLGGFVDQLSSMDGNIMDNLLLGKADDLVNSTADLLGMNYDQALDLLSGVAEGAIKGGDLESIVGGVIENFATVQIQNYLTSAFGNVANVDDWFGPGQSHIPMEAFEPIISGSIQAALNGGMSAEDAIKMAWGYFQEGGDIDFMLPKFSEFLATIPGLDFEKGGWGIGYDPESGDIVINHDFDFDFDWGGIGSLPEIGNPCTTAEGQEGKILAGKLQGTFLCEGSIDTPYDCTIKGAGWTWDNLVGDCIPPVDTPYDCTARGEGWTWDNLIGDCIPPISGVYCTPEQEQMGWSWDSFKEECLPPGGIIDGVYCTDEQEAMGWSWDSFKEECLPPLGVEPIYCTEEQEAEGWSWDSFKEECLPPVDVTPLFCTEEQKAKGWSWDSFKEECVPEFDGPEPIYCTEEQEAMGWSWDSAKEECLPETKGPDTNCPAGWESQDGHCVEINIECPDGWADEDGTCINLPTPHLSSGATKPHDMQWSGLFEWTPIEGYTAKQLAPQHNYIKQAKGMLS
jgi:hypothetical protein